eukprot:5047430-Prymnesium_polylepis.2
MLPQQNPDALPLLYSYLAEHSITLRSFSEGVIDALCLRDETTDVADSEVTFNPHGTSNAIIADAQVFATASIACCPHACYCPWLEWLTLAFLLRSQQIVTRMATATGRKVNWNTMVKDLSNLRRMKTSANLVAEVSSSLEATTRNAATLGSQMVHFADHAAQLVPEPLAAAGTHAIDILSEASAPVHRAKEAIAAHIPEQVATRSCSIFAVGAHAASALSKATTELASHLLPGQATSYAALLTFNSSEAGGVNDVARALAKAGALKVQS